MNLIFVISDTFRADYIGCYGSSWVKTPNIDSLAARSVLFENHHAASFPTLPARADFFLGKWTFAYRGWEPIPPEEMTLAARVSGAGHATVGVVDTPFYMADGFAYDRGFDYFTDLDSQRLGLVVAPKRPQLIVKERRSEYDYAAPRTFALAEQYLERVYKRPFFMVVDTWDPHEPWDPPEYYVRKYLPDYDGRQVSPPYRPYVEAGLTEDDLAVARACYAGEITMVDRWIGRLLERVQSLGIEDDTAIVFTSDHGFYFGEHGFLGKMVLGPGPARERTAYWHASPLYREITHVPLIVHVPGVPSKRVNHLTSAIDIMPTIHELVTGDTPEGVHGQSLVRCIRGELCDPPAFVVTSPPLANPGAPIRVVDDVSRYVVDYLAATINTADWTLLFTSRRHPPELYAATDITQEQNRAGEHPEVVESIVGDYENLLREVGTSADYLEPRFG